MKWDIFLERYTKKKLNEEIIKRQLRRIAKEAERNQSLGFITRIGKIEEPPLVNDPSGEEAYLYRTKIRVQKKTGDATLAHRHFNHVFPSMVKASISEKWKIIGQSHNGVEINGDDMEEPPVISLRPPFHPPELTAEALEDFFRGIYEREAHIRLIHDSVCMYASTLLANQKDPAVEISRSHVLLKGKPAGCKTRLFERFKAFYESGGEAEADAERVTFIDGPTMTKAGLENWLLEKAKNNDLAEIIVIEELEKQNPDNLLTLVSLMSSGYISKMNARIGFQRAAANALIWATCNDDEVIRKFRHGVLWSRFSCKLHCARPSAELMRQILLDKVEKMGGDPLWVDKALELAYVIIPKHNGGEAVDDPREIERFLNGRERLLTGDYQRDCLEVIRAEQKERMGGCNPLI